MNSFETGLKSITLYVEKLDNTHCTICLSAPSYFQLQTKLEHEIKEVPSNKLLVVDRNKQQFQIADNNDVLRLEHQDELYFLDPTTIQKPVQYLRYAPLCANDLRAQALLPPEASIVALCGENLIKMWWNINAPDENQILEMKSFGKFIVQQFKSVGYIRVQPPEDYIKSNIQLYSVVKNFFQLPTETKLNTQQLNFTRQNQDYQNKLGYGIPQTAWKEYFIHRNVDVKLYETNSIPLHSSLSKFFNYQTLLSSSVAYCVLQYLGMSWKLAQSLLLKCDERVRNVQDIGYYSMMECFRYQSPSSVVAEDRDKVFVGCAEHSDISLLTCIPQCFGTPGLEIMAWKTDSNATTNWYKVETHVNQSVVFPGEQMFRISNGFIAPTVHRVFLSPSQDKFRYSFPYELMMSPDTVVNCKAWLNSDIVGAISETFSKIESVKEIVSNISSNLISVNK